MQVLLNFQDLKFSTDLKSYDWKFCKNHHSASVKIVVQNNGHKFLYAEAE